MSARLFTVLALGALACASERPQASDELGLLSDYAPGAADPNYSPAEGGSAGTGGTGSAPPDGVTVGSIDGLAAVISGSGCIHVWTMRGDQCPGCGLAWDVELSYMDATCDPLEDRFGTFEMVYGAVYFNGTYWGNVDRYGGGYIYWRSPGYGYGYYSEYETVGEPYYLGYADY